VEVWNAIQVALQQAGFVVAEVTALDKVQGRYRQVSLSSDKFLNRLRSRIPEHDGMAFLAEQVAIYDNKRAQVTQAPQMELFVSDKRSAIDWLVDFLKARSSTYQETHPEFITQLSASWKKHEAKAPDLDRKREKALPKEFLTYSTFGGGVPARGAARGLQGGLGPQGLRTIITVAKTIPEETLQEDEKLQLWHDQALTRMETAS